MRIILLLLCSLTAFGQLKYIYNPFTGNLDATSAASGTVTSVVIQGTANEIEVSGTCTVTTSGTCMIGIVDAPTITGTNITGIPPAGVTGTACVLTGCTFSGTVNGTTFSGSGIIATSNNGTAGAPAFVFAGRGTGTNWGLYSSGTSSIDVSIGGTQIQQFWSDGSQYVFGANAQHHFTGTGAWIDWNSDVSISRAAAGIFQVGTSAAPGAAGTLKVTNVWAVAVAVGSLPSCAAGTLGYRATVNDSNAVSFTAGIGAVVAAGGSTIVPVFCDGTNWRIG